MHAHCQRLTNRHDPINDPARGGKCVEYVARSKAELRDGLLFRPQMGADLANVIEIEFKEIAKPNRVFAFGKLLIIKPPDNVIAFWWARGAAPVPPLSS